MPETWQCGHCPLQVALPDEVLDPEGYADTIAIIREHRFIHIASRFILMGLSGKTDEALMVECEDGEPVTIDDVIPALAEVDRILRRVG